MADQVDEIKQKIDIVGIISEYVDLKRAGRNYKALCPFHSEWRCLFFLAKIRGNGVL